MTISFEEYCEDYLDLHSDILSGEELRSAKAGYAELLSGSGSYSGPYIEPEKTPAGIAKHKKALEKAKESRKLAKFYGGKALTGTAAQKKWAEEIRERVMKSSALSDEQKTELVNLGDIVKKARFWIDNRDKDSSAFNPATILAEATNLRELYNKHYNTLTRRGPSSEKERARKEIYTALSSLSVAFKFEFPACDFYDEYGVLKTGLKFKC